MSGDTTALVRRQDQAPEPFTPQNLDQAFRLAQDLAQSNLLPSHLRGKPSDVFVTLLLARDLGLTAMQGITGIFVVEGKPSVSAQTAVALVKRSPLCKFFRTVETSATVAICETWREGDPEPQRMKYTIEDAARAGLAGKSVWKSHPAAMLRARASVQLARDVYPDVIANVYDEDELDEIRERVAGEKIVAPPPPPVVTRAPAPIPATAQRTASPPPAPPTANHGPTAATQARFEAAASADRAGAATKPMRPAAAAPAQNAGPDPRQRDGKPEKDEGEADFDRMVDPAPAPPAADQRTGEQLVDVIAGQLGGATTKAEIVQLAKDMDRLSAKDKAWLVPSADDGDGEPYYQAAVVRVIDQGPLDDLDWAFSIVGKLRGVGKITPSLIEMATASYKARKAAP